MREVYIFDIDGCIMPLIFSNFNSKESRINNVKEVIKNGNSVKIYPDFVKFYEKYCVQAESVYFITGRKESEFDKLTENQLQPLANIKPFQIIYYPERQSHKIKKYFTWKARKIKEIIKNTINSKNFSKNSQENVKFTIFDDLNNYFPKIRKFKDKYRVQIQLTLIENENCWNH